MRKAFIVSILTLFSVSCGSDTPDSPINPTPTPPPPSSITLTAPTHVTPADDQQLNTLQPVLVVSNVTASQSGARTYEFEVATNADFTNVVVRGQNVAEDASGRTSWTVTPSVESTTRFWWRARAVQGSATGPWSNATRFRSRIEGFNRPGELFDPLVNGATVGTPINVTFLAEQGARLDSLGSRIVYTLPQTLNSGEFSLLATGLTTHSDGDSTKLFAMQEGFTDLTTNPYRATIEKRDHGTVTFRFIAGNSDTRADGERIDLEFNPSLVYFWKFTWGGGLARLVVLEGGEQGRVIYDRSDPYGGTYRPSPHIAYVGAPPGRAGIITASVPGAVVRYVWLSSRPRPAGLETVD
jgi:hypothetical protein